MPARRRAPSPRPDTEQSQPTAVAQALLAAARTLRAAVDGLCFHPPVVHVYNPLGYAHRPHETYLTRYGSRPKRVVLLGMNPGPFGMMQTGVPFGEVAAVRDWLGISAAVEKPIDEHPRRPIEGFRCSRSEVSGARLWGLFAARFGDPASFFEEHFVLNYCPLAFLEASGRNRTPDKLPASEVAPLYDACDEHLRTAVAALDPEWVIGIGGFAHDRARHALADLPLRFGRILHPSPASPAANRDWAGNVTRQLIELGVWPAAA